MPTTGARLAIAAAFLAACSTLNAGPGQQDDAEYGRCTDGVCEGRDGEPPVCTPSTPCGEGGECKTSDDCLSACVDGKCTAPSDTDGKKNNGETDVDCGGPNAKKCFVGKACVEDADCNLRFCDEGTCGLPSPTDGVKNGTETDVDCGGAEQTEGDVTVAAAPRCDPPKKCLVDGDCTSSVCADIKVCTEAPSCRPLHGGHTCGTGEYGQPGAVHESCCKSLPVPGMTMMQNGVAKQVYLDKYEITAGRVRAWIADIKAQNGGVPNIQKWVKDRLADDPILAATFPAVRTDQKPPSGPANTADYLPSGQTGPFITLPLMGGGSASFDFGLLSQIGPTSYWRGTQVTGTTGCGMYPDAYGHRTYWFEKAESDYFSELVRPVEQKDWLDEKSANCMTVLMYAAFCAWDGGYLPSRPVLYAAWGAQAWPWGTGPAPNDEAAKIANFNAGTGSFSPSNPPRYLYPAVNYGTFASDFSPIIAAPGRFPGDIGSVVRPGQESWMDLGGNMLEWTYEAGTYYGWSGASFEGHHYGRSGTSVLYFLDKYGKAATRCMRLR